MAAKKTPPAQSPAGAPATAQSAQPAKFEESLARLEKIVETLEGGDMDLDQSLALFEEGRRLSRECLERLQQIEQKVLVAIEQSNGEVKLENAQSFEESGGSESG